MASKAQAIKFGPQDKSKIKGKIGHTRTGACTSRGKCTHSWRHQHNKNK